MISFFKKLFFPYKEEPTITECNPHQTVIETLREYEDTEDVIGLYNKEYCKLYQLAVYYNDAEMLFSKSPELSNSSQKFISCEDYFYENQSINGFIKRTINRLERTTLNSKQLSDIHEVITMLEFLTRS